MRPSTASPRPRARSGAGEGSGRDATGRVAGETAAAAGVRRLTLMHLDPRLDDHAAVLREARAAFPDAQLGEDGMPLAL